MMAGLGHNGGPALTGISWRRHCWQAAREKLLPTLPIEVVRMRVRRAAQLGLDYKTYAGVRATTGRDIIAFLFSSNALRLERQVVIPEAHCARLRQLKGVERIGLGQSLSGAQLYDANPEVLEAAFDAPNPHANFPTLRAQLRAAMGSLPADGVVLIRSDAPWEGEWAAAGKMAGSLSADRFFAA